MAPATDSVRRWPVAIAGWVALSMLPATVEASGFDVPAIGSTFSSPVGDDAAAVYWNPAMLGYAKQGEALAGLGMVGGFVRYDRQRLGSYQFEDSLQFAEPIDVAYNDASKTGPAGSATTPLVSPWLDAFGTIPVVPDRFSLGLGFYVPYAAPLNFPDEGPQRWALQQAFIAVTRVGLSAAVKAHDAISFGAGISYVFGLASLRKVQDFGAVDALAQGLAADPLNQANSLGSMAPSTVRELEVFSRPIAFTDGTSHGVSFNAGVAIRPVDPLTIGINYDHGERLRFKGDFSLDMNDDFFTQDLAAEGLEFPPLVEGTGVLEFRLAKRVMAGVAYDINERVRVDGSFAYVFWSDLDAFEFELTSPDLEQPALGLPATTSVLLPRDWLNTVHAEVSVRAQLKPRLRLSATLGYHSGASPDSTVDVASPDGNRLLGAAGLGIQLNDRIGILADMEVQGLIPRTVTTSDFDLGNGRYQMVIGSTAIHLQARFGGRSRAGSSDLEPLDAADGGDENEEPGRDSPAAAGAEGESIPPEDDDMGGPPAAPKSTGAA
jgi:long-chain fatty acid transport protein